MKEPSHCRVWPPQQALLAQYIYSDFPFLFHLYIFIFTFNSFYESKVAKFSRENFAEKIRLVNEKRRLSVKTSDFFFGFREAEMRGASGDSRALNNALETISAAATAIASAENRAPQATVQVRIFLPFFTIFFFSNSNCVNLIVVIEMIWGLSVSGFYSFIDEMWDLFDFSFLVK